MFNAIFGNFLFSSRSTAQPQQQLVETGTQTSNMSSASTQTIEDDKLKGNNQISTNNELQSQFTQMQTQTDNCLAANNNNNSRCSDINVNSVSVGVGGDYGKNISSDLNDDDLNKSKGEQDWVIVDPSEEADKCVNYQQRMQITVDQQEQSTQATGTSETACGENVIEMEQCDKAENERIEDEHIQEDQEQHENDDQSLNEELEEIKEIADLKRPEQNKLTDSLVAISTVSSSATVAALNQSYDCYHADDDQDDIMLGSFFDKNEFPNESETNYKSKVFALEENDDDESDVDEKDEEIIQHEVIAPKLNKKDDETWLITPLPCLTSITSSQRSIVENAPLENLLIEHPSMSVFMSATSSSDLSFSLIKHDEELEEKAIVLPEVKCAQSGKQVQQQQQQVQTQQHQLFKSASIKNSLMPLDINNSKPTRIITQSRKANKLEKKKLLSENAQNQKQQAKQQEQQPCVLVKSVAEKRKESESSSKDSCERQASPSAAALISPNSAILFRRKEKKNKSSGSSSPSSVNAKSNKENLQVKAYLLVDHRKSLHGTASSNRFDLTLVNKNQMKRNNKNATLTRNANLKQRKYHNLQQPNFSSNSQF